MSPMTDEQLLARLADREDNYTERKPDGVKPEEIRQTICAFSNSLTVGATAVLYIGIHDKTGVVLGVDNSDTVQKRVREAIDRCYPPITNYAMRVLDVEGKVIVAAKVGASDDRPHFTGPAFVRRGSESVNASPELFKELIDSRHSKVAAIRRLLGGPAITVHCLGRKLTDPRPVEARYLEEHLADVRDCNIHEVKIYSHSCCHLVSVPLESVQIGTDIKHNRPMLTIIS